MRIGFLLEQFPAVSETFILRQLTGLMDAGHEVQIFANSAGRLDIRHGAIDEYRLNDRTTYMEIPQASGIREESVLPLTTRTWIDELQAFRPNAWRIAAAVPTLGYCIASNPRAALGTLSAKRYGYHAESLSSLYRMRSVLNWHQTPDVAHAHFGPVGREFQFVRDLWGVPLVVSFHGYDFSSWPKKFGADAYRGLFETLDLATIHSDFGRQRLIELGCPSNKIRILPCGIETGSMPDKRKRNPGNTAQPVTFLTVGRLVEKKGVLDSLKGFARASKNSPGMRYEIIGDGPLREQVWDLVAAQGLQEQVVLYGAKSTEFVRERMEAADVFILTSRMASDGDVEGTPVSLLEAQATGLPVISTLHAGIPEIVKDGSTGILVREGDVDGIAAAVSRLADDAALRGEMGAAGRRFMETAHNIRRLNLQLLAIYEEAVSLYRPTRN